jgi:AraC-like DNA-binding protein/ligand-binding sensor protein
MKTAKSSTNDVVAIPPTDTELIEKLKAASFYQIYQNAFRSATGLPLVLVSADREGFNPCHASENQNPFCRAINTGENPCASCALAQKCTLKGAKKRSETIECFAGMKETAVPIWLGERIVGYLKTGQVFTHQPSRANLAALEEALLKGGRTDQQIRKLMKLYLQTPVMEEEKYASMITLLSAFGLQLAGLMNRVVLESRVVELEPVRRAKEYIRERIDDKISLEDVSAAVNVSTYYFCKIFKQSTGMTFTEYVNRQRIELAKREILKPDRRVTEVAYDVGYQSLSQFNRSFLKIVGESPTQFRKRMTSGSGGNAVLVA